MSAATISRGEHDRIVREALAGVFALTPLDLYVYLGGDAEAFDEVARAIMEWWLRSHGYAEEEVAPACLLVAAQASLGSPRGLAGGCDVDVRGGALRRYRRAFRSGVASNSPGAFWSRTASLTIRSSDGLRRPRSIPLM